MSGTALDLISMRLFYLCYPKSQTLSDFLSWSHWVELLKLDDPLERSFYEQQRERENTLRVRAMKRPREAMKTLFLIAASACCIRVRGRFGLNFSAAGAAGYDGGVTWA